MARFFCCAVLVALALGGNPQKKEVLKVEHGGKVVDGATWKPLKDVKVDAFASSRAATAADCSASDGVLAMVKTEDGGKFALKIDPGHVNFATRYCADGYAPRIDPTNDNAPNARIQPEPVHLVRRVLSGAELKKLLGNLRYVVQKKVADLEVKYTPEVISRVMRSLPDDEVTLFRGLRPSVRAGRIDVVYEQRVLDEVGRISTDLVSDFDYLLGAVPETVCGSITKNDPFGDYLLWRCAQLPGE